jgi:hypothetical protein
MYNPGATVIAERSSRGTRAFTNVGLKFARYHQLPVKQARARATVIIEATTMVRQLLDRLDVAGMP